MWDSVRDYFVGEVLGAAFSSEAWTMWVVALLAGGLYVYLRRKHPGWASAVPITLAVVLMMVLIQLGIKTQKALARQTQMLEQLTAPPKAFDPDSIEGSLKGWVFGLKWGIQPTTDDKAMFAYRVTLGTGAVVSIFREREFSQFLTVAAGFPMNATQRSAIENVSAAARDRLISELRIKLAGSGSNYQGMTAPLTQAIVFRRIPITASLGEAQLLTTVESVNAGRLLAAEVVAKHLGR